MRHVQHSVIRVLVADDHSLLRKGIVASLAASRRIEIVGEACNGHEAIELAQRLLPDVLVLDITMPKLNGLEVTAALRRTQPRCKILIISMHEDREYIYRSVRSGARGYILKDGPSSDIVRAVEAVGSGRTFFSELASQAIMESVVDGSGAIESPGGKELSQREVEVLALVADGLANRDIAGRLGISVRTVETHRERIMIKLDIHNSAGLTKYAISRGLVKLARTP
ncbi:MAG: response regulator transcription factor [Candidatus Terrybacteria bacterium]|nr:response regulator transcription factor [Candidatus Terrybacteria bacterium]